MNIELYIAGQLCDLEKADLGIKLRRQLYNPKELNTKDSQKSYSITLPATARNNEIFGHKNVEETVGKFTLYPDARLYVNNILILDGKFRLSEISSKGYRGNLGVPAPLTAKDVFGERKMNDIDPWIIPFEGEKSLTEYNTTLKPDGNLRECIFPLVLYGLLPGTNSTNLDNATAFTLQNLPPSVNCKQMLQHIFQSANYSLTGTAMEDERLSSLYMSYKNPESHPMSFEVKKMKLKGYWTNMYKSQDKRERQVVANEHAKDYTNNTDGAKPSQGFVACNLFRSDNLDVKSHQDDSHHLRIFNNNQVEYIVPHDGLYKISLDATISLIHDQGRYWERVVDMNDQTTPIDIMSANYNTDKRSFENVAVELKLIRQRGSDSEKLELSDITMDNTFSQDNQPRNTTLEDNKSPNPNAIFPQLGCVNFVDPKQNPNYLCGFSWGRMTAHNGNYTRKDGYNFALYDFEHPQWKNNREMIANPMAIKHGKSWKGNLEEKISKSAVFSPGYISVDTGSEEREATEVGKYMVELNDTDTTAFLTNYSGSTYYGGKGTIHQMVWLDQGDKLNLVTCQNRSSKHDWMHQEITFELSVEAFSANDSWITIEDKEGNSTAPMQWGDNVLLLVDRIDLSKFLPTEMKIDDWITNFCKAFNLELVHRGDKSFALNMKEANIVKNTSLVIDLDKKANISHANNESLALPRAYKLGFTIDTAETGYVESAKDKEFITEGDTGGGTFETGSNENNTVEQTSNFSYCWYKKLKKFGSEIPVPVITDNEVWTSNDENIRNKTYLNKALRFWFHNPKRKITQKVYSTAVDLAVVSGKYEGKKDLYLNYEDKPNSIMREYFTLLTNDKELTCVECYLTPEEYDMLDRAYVRLNGDLYNVVDADGFDLMGNGKTKLKLIKKI